jgi:glycosyltransferase involved in cell wall biosynthesis
VPPDAEERRRKLGLPERYLVTVATLEPRKGLDVLLDALAQGPDLPLAVAGPPGWGDIDVASEARSRGLQDRVIALGQLRDEDLAAVVGGATALVQPSREEGFGLPVLEAMSLGTPAVISDAPALVEVAGGAAIVTPVGDPAALSLALQALIADPGHGELLRDAGLRRAADFSWIKAADAMWGIYSQALGR